jgi:6-phosphofructokinase 2
MSRIVTLTLNPALDKSTTAERFVPEQKLRCQPLQIDPGGGGINVSKGIAKLGGESIAVFPAGGANGLLLRQLVEAAGIRTEVVETAADTRENFSVTETSTNLQYRFTLPGQPLQPAEAEACLERIRHLRPDWLVASGSLPSGLPDDFYERVAVLAHDIDARFVLDTSGKPLQAAADEGLFLLKPNLGELAALCGRDELPLHEVDDAALSIIQAGKCEVVVVSLGPQGALLVTRDGFEHIPAPMVTKRSTVGAGDSMVAGMTHALSTGLSYRQMARLGVACGSAATMNTGTQLFEKQEVSKLLDWIETYGERYRITDF